MAVSDNLLLFFTGYSRSASKIARHWIAVNHYVKTGKDSYLRLFRRDYIQVEKQRIPFLTDPVTIDLLAARGEISFESIYAQAA